MDLTIEGKAYINGSFEKCCIGVDQGRISSIKKISKGDEHLDFGNKLILPAGIDIHVHFRDPGMTHKEDFSTGSLAAVFGGMSCVFDMPNTIPQTTDFQILSDKIASMGKKSYVDFGVYSCITNSNIKNIRGIGKKCSGFKIYLGSSTNSLQLDTSNLREVFTEINSTNKPVLIHAEDKQCLDKYKTKERNLVDHLHSRPSKCEEKAIRDILESSRNINSKIHICHLSSCEGLELLKNRAENVSCGVTPHHLLLSVEKNLKPQSRYKVNPPLRTSFDREILFEGMRNGFIDMLESDHAPHTLEESDVDFGNAPSGLPGVETMFPLFLYMAKKRMLSFQRLISIICERPAELVGMPKGKIEVGRDADIIVVDIKKDCKIKSEYLHSKCEWSPFESWPAIFPTHVFVRGEKLIEEHEMLGNQGFGRFVGK
jgi:dihydroorotase